MIKRYTKGARLGVRKTEQEAGQEKWLEQKKETRQYTDRAPPDEGDPVVLTKEGSSLKLSTAGTYLADDALKPGHTWPPSLSSPPSLPNQKTEINC